MVNISANGIMELHRGDTFVEPIYVNIGTALNPYYYNLQGTWVEIPESKRSDYNYVKEVDDKLYGYDGDVLYFALLEPNQRWEQALIRKAFLADDFDPEDQSVTLRFEIEDTEYLVPGNYYYEVKLYRAASSCQDNLDRIDTVIGRTKFVIME